MKNLNRLAAAALVAALAGATGAEAGVPFPWYSTIDPALALCPAGDLAFHVIPRRFNDPVPNAILVVDFCDASGWNFGVSGQSPAIFFPAGFPCRPATFTDASGLATLALKAGGTTTDSTVVLYVDGVLFGRRTLASPDQNGDLLVNAADEAILAARLGTPDRSADLDGDGVVSEADRTILRAHLGHAAEQPTAVATTSWGRIKALRR